jgi:Domain of unknown function (DUF4157)
MKAHQQSEPAHREHGPRRTPDHAEHATGPAQVLALQRTVGNAAVADELAARSSVHEVLRSPGRPLGESVRTDMESRLDADFTDVRLHTDAVAQRSADEVGARAWTSGSHVVIGRDGTDDHTLAHELTHVLQQRSGPVAGTDDGTGLRISDPADRFERDAETNATRAMSGAATSVHDTAVARSLGTQQIQRITSYSESGVDYQVSESGLFAIVDGERQIWARPGVRVSGALIRNPAGDRTIAGQPYLEYQISNWILKDCLHTAEEIINGLPGQLHSARDLDLVGAGPSEGRYSRIKADTGRWRQFGGSEEQNITNARAFGGPNNADAAPGLGEAFVILATLPRTQQMSPYHAGAVVGIDGSDRVTLEEWDLRGEVSRGEAHMYKVGSARRSFHGVWGAEGRYFGAHEPITVVISAVARPPTGLNTRTRDLNVFGPNTFGDEADRTTTGWPPSP